MKKLNLLIIICSIMFASCEQSDPMSPASANDSKTNTGSETGNTGTGKAGSLARFTIHGNTLYTLVGDSLLIFRIDNSEKPVRVGMVMLGAGVETLFTRNSSDPVLFTGSQNGMSIYSITNPQNPRLIGSYAHVLSCDPVAANGTHAFVTLRSDNSRCGRNVNELQVIDITHPATPMMVSNIQMTHPIGVGVDQNTVFVCDDQLKIYDASNPENPILINQFPIKGTDVIANNNLLMVIGSDGLVQYDYSGSSMTRLSTIPVQR